MRVRATGSPVLALGVVALLSGGCDARGRSRRRRRLGTEANEIREAVVAGQIAEMGAMQAMGRFVAGISDAPIATAGEVLRGRDIKRYRLLRVNGKKGRPDDEHAK